jgi:hypothetical protein
MPKEKCLNCGCAIGDLETPYLFDERIVCKSCYSKLQPASRIGKRGVVVGGVVIAVIACVAIGLFLKSKSKSEADGQVPGTTPGSNSALQPATRLYDDDIFKVVRANPNATPDQLSGILTTALGGRRIIDDFEWGVSKRSGYKDGVELEVRNLHGDAAGVDRSLEIMQADPKYNNSDFFGTAIINQKVYVLYGATLFMSPSQSTQAAALPLDTQNVGFVGEVTFGCFESSGKIFITLYLKNAEFN